MLVFAGELMGAGTLEMTRRENGIIISQETMSIDESAVISLPESNSDIFGTWWRVSSLEYSGRRVLVRMGGRVKSVYASCAWRKKVNIRMIPRGSEIETTNVYDIGGAFEGGGVCDVVRNEHWLSINRYSGAVEPAVGVCQATAANALKEGVLSLDGNALIDGAGNEVKIISILGNSIQPKNTARFLDVITQMRARPQKIIDVVRIEGWRKKAQTLPEEKKIAVETECDLYLQLA